VYLLKTLKIPAALVEVGFLSHPGEARLLADEAYQKKVAAAIYRGILSFAAGRAQGGNPR
jgi:N-acetylmuramoyl-L-alanine amidase